MSDNFIPLSIPHISGNEWKYVKECLDTGWVSSAGKYVDLFEKDVKQFVGTKYATACVNGTSALQIALKIVGVRASDEVIVPTLTFIASVNVINYLGANPIFMDCDEFYNIDIVKTIEFIQTNTEFLNGVSINKTTGKRISAIIPVHIFGNPVNFANLVEICKERNIKIVEDCAESIGSYYLDSKKQTGTIGDIACFSFNGNKLITTGGGGMIVTDNKEYAEKAKYLTTQAKDNEIEYVHNEIGFNFRLTYIQAALGVAQLEQLLNFIKIKRENYFFLKSQIDEIQGLNLANIPEYAVSNCWYYCLQVDGANYSMNRIELFDYVYSHGVQTRPVWLLNHLQKPYQNCESYKITKAPKLHSNTLNIPCSVNLSQYELNRIICLLQEVTN